MGQVLQMRRNELRKHWVSIPSPIIVTKHMGEEPTEQDKQFEDALIALGLMYEGSNLVFKTWDEREATEIVQKIEKVCDNFDGVWPCKDNIEHRLQVQCLKCGELADFGSFYCSQCIWELLGKMYV